jgi:hypothetical protein
VVQGPSGEYLVRVGSGLADQLSFGLSVKGLDRTLPLPDVERRTGSIGECSARRAQLRVNIVETKRFLRVVLEAKNKPAGLKGDGRAIVAHLTALPLSRVRWSSRSSDLAITFCSAGLAIYAQTAPARRIGMVPRSGRASPLAPRITARAVLSLLQAANVRDDRVNLRVRQLVFVGRILPEPFFVTSISAASVILRISGTLNDLTFMDFPDGVSPTPVTP